MTTMFDVGDLVQATFMAKIISYTINKDKDDCYTLVIVKPNGEEVSRVYLSSEDLRHMDAKKIDPPVPEWEYKEDGTVIHNFVL